MAIDSFVGFGRGTTQIKSEYDVLEKKIITVEGDDKFPIAVADKVTGFAKNYQSYVSDLLSEGILDWIEACVNYQGFKKTLKIDFDQDEERKSLSDVATSLVSYADNWVDGKYIADEFLLAFKKAGEQIKKYDLISQNMFGNVPQHYDKMFRDMVKLYTKDDNKISAPIGGIL